jgi:hypothetical protein
VDEKIHGEVATKEDLLLQKAELKEDMSLMKAELKSDMAILKAELREELWKLRLMVVIALVVVVVLNPKVLELEDSTPSKSCGCSYKDAGAAGFRL